tara:strand:- start:151 stop:291 length:141 start_codon:yes stop_codon:yes gene_type:complete
MAAIKKGVRLSGFVPEKPISAACHFYKTQNSEANNLSIFYLDRNNF